ncbi:hypothetical protein WICMUC_004834 [Wickerhamomyces mucosus]|uniref:Uncharacterized protein n=1 Tax=Wickerhamomyces mucosus TaxID=1378264 RepID=A0A9P8T8J5_9ASCO|nr:hypothetical protein WICMUC_004834 [Wickerhamomyces mucosus]
MASCSLSIKSKTSSVLGLLDVCSLYLLNLPESELGTSKNGKLFRGELFVDDFDERGTVELNMGVLVEIEEFEAALLNPEVLGAKNKLCCCKFEALVFKLTFGVAVLPIGKAYGTPKLELRSLDKSPTVAKDDLL